MHTNTFYLNAKHINPLNSLKIKNLMSILETKNRSNSILTISTVYIHIQDINFCTHVTIVCLKNDWIYHWILNPVFTLWHGTICDDGIYVRQEIFYNIHPFCQVRHFKVHVDDGRRRIWNSFLNYKGFYYLISIPTLHLDAPFKYVRLPCASWAQLVCVIFLWFFEWGVINAWVNRNFLCIR